MSSVQNEDKSLRYVVQLIVTIIIGLVGVYLRFADFRYSSIISDLIFIVAIILMFRIVFAWMK